VQGEVRRLRVAGLLDDAALARAVGEAAARRGYGRRAVRATLYRRRVPRRVAEEAVAALSEAEVGGALVRSLSRALRKYPAWKRLPAERRKVIRYLLTRGFGADAVRDALATATGDGWDAGDEIEPLDSPELP